jgi:hypothetical protein
MKFSNLICPMNVVLPLPGSYGKSSKLVVGLAEFRNRTCDELLGCSKLSRDNRAIRCTSVHV